MTENAPPLQYLKDGEVVGKTAEFIERISKKANFETKISILPWARAYQTVLIQKDIFIYPFVSNAERESKFIWIGEIFTLNLTWVPLKSRKEVKINHLDDDKKYKTGVIRADATFNYLIKNGFNKKEHFIIASELPLLLDLLYSEKIDSFIVDIALLKEMAMIHSS